VIRCTSSGTVDAPGFVDVLPLVNQVDGDGNSTPHETVHNLPFFRLQGGRNAAIIDPEPDDIGLACFASRDTSNVETTGKQAPPASLRRFDWADGLYLGAFPQSGAPPTQYVQFNASGITVVSPTAITLQAPTISLNASQSVSASAPDVSLQGSSSIEIGSPANTISGGNTSIDGVEFLPHFHSDSGGSGDGGPVAG
jgi:hypothetical protein